MIQFPRISKYLDVIDMDGLVEHRVAGCIGSLHTQPSKPLQLFTNSVKSITMMLVNTINDNILVVG